MPRSYQLTAILQNRASGITAIIGTVFAQVLLQVLPWTRLHLILCQLELSRGNRMLGALEAGPGILLSGWSSARPATGVGRTPDLGSRDLR